MIMRFITAFPAAAEDHQYGRMGPAMLFGIEDIQRKTAPPDCPVHDIRPDQDASGAFRISYRDIRPVLLFFQKRRRNIKRCITWDHSPLPAGCCKSNGH
jgi:hypothetical protein